jgi:hypothetical protein
MFSLSFKTCFGLMRPSSGVHPLTEPAALYVVFAFNSAHTRQNRVTQKAELNPKMA